MATQWTAAAWLSLTDAVNNGVSDRLSQMVQALTAAALTAAPSVTAPAEHPTAPADTGSQESIISVPRGVYIGAAPTGPQKVENFESWLGHDLQLAIDYPPSDTWDELEGQDWQLSAWRDSTHQLVWGFAPYPKTGGHTLEACANGDYNHHYRELATNLVNYDLADAILRPGLEFNGNWMHWTAIGKGEAFAGCFRNIVSTMRSVDGQHFEVTWNPNVGGTAMNPETAWPGSAYVDHIGLDAYDISWIPNTYPYNNPDMTSAESIAAQETVLNEILHGQYGFDHWRDFARTHGVKLAVPEWGVWTMESGHGGGDNPLYVNGMTEYMAALGDLLAYEAIFSFDNWDGTHDITGGTFPRAAEAYKASFVQPAAPEPTPEPTAEPTSQPTAEPTAAPSPTPTTSPEPTNGPEPTPTPTDSPTEEPEPTPTDAPKNRGQGKKSETVPTSDRTPNKPSKTPKARSVRVEVDDSAPAAPQPGTPRGARNTSFKRVFVIFPRG